MQVYRIAAEQFAGDLSGEGARLYGGRWNPQGMPVLYTAESLPLALLETLVNVPADFLTTALFCRVTLSIPDETSFTTIFPHELPAEWQAYPPPKALAEMGRQWLTQKETVGFKVPSTVVGGHGWNLLFNPRHPAFGEVTVESVEPFIFDARLLRR
jgi:RES domain-containing protein